MMVIFFYATEIHKKDKRVGDYYSRHFPYYLIGFLYIQVLHFQSIGFHFDEKLFIKERAHAPRQAPQLNSFALVYK
ncbi:hypothetical protein OKW21_003633 [Catalinimonas alkaloidigena]|uniref:hypothetical protein n=1 Tax=Catalinimonas alkaloidigena TaxID=1075417 RepID=UPI00240618F4|nr:hypothetical protein [Catalinimonas alkaloidigena]MDF9798370.1 hypothetical protein [Catalinimonas alkaloidigena]